MKTRYLIAAAAALLAAGPAQAQSVEGVWTVESGKARVEIGPCGGEVCGKIVWLKEPLDDAGAPKVDRNNEDEALRSRPIMGMNMLAGFTDQGGGHWSGGEIYNAEDGGTYRSEMRLVDADTLSVEGCWFLFCKAQTWKRHQ